MTNSAEELSQRDGPIESGSGDRPKRRLTRIERSLRTHRLKIGLGAYCTDSVKKQ